MKKIISIIVTLSCLFALTACSKSQSSGAASSSADTQTVTMSDDLKDLTFTLDGVVYQFPCTYQTFIDNGWVNCTHQLYEDNGWDNEDEFDPEGTVNTHQEIWKYQYLKKGDDMIKIADFYNHSSEIKPLSQCYVLRIEFADDSMDPSHIVLAKGIDLRFTPDDLKKAYGNPDEDDDFYTYYLSEGDFEGDHRNKIVFGYQDEMAVKDGDNYFANTISIECFADHMK